MYKSNRDSNPYAQLPTARKIKRTCSKELYRTIKKLNVWIPPEQVIEGEKLYVQKVAPHLPWIVENANHRKKLADWWVEHVCPELAELWKVEENVLAKAFRDSFKG